MLLQDLEQKRFSPSTIRMWTFENVKKMIINVVERLKKKKTKERKEKECDGNNWAGTQVRGQQLIRPPNKSSMRVEFPATVCRSSHNPLSV